MSLPDPVTPRPRWWMLWLPFVAALAGGLILSAPPAQAAELRPLPPFEAISLQAAVDVTVRQTGRESVRVDADPAVLPRIETVVEDGTDGRTLTIRVSPGERLPSGARVRIEVDVAQLGGLAVRGSGDVTVETLKTPALKLAITGSGDILVRGLDTERLDVSIVGSGDVRADGRARELALSMRGSGDAALGELTADSAQVSIAGSGDATVRASQAVVVSIAGSGDVLVLGNPPSVKKSVAGSGEVVIRR